MPAQMSRRHAMLAAAALPLGAAALPRMARAAAEMQGPGPQRFNRFTLGGMEVTALLAATRTVPDPQTIFGLNATEEEFEEISEANFIPTDRAQFFFTPTLVNTGEQLILFDTGTDAEAITSALQAAGHEPDEVDLVVLTHMHGDHIGGLMADGAPTFGNARYMAGSVEHNHWMQAGNEGFDTMVRPLNDQMDFVEGGDSVAPGITMMEAFGHTPGHMAVMLESEGEQLALIADTANHYVWSLAQPDWEVRFDMDKAAAAATRREMFGMLAADRIPFIGYHMPFPAMGYVEEAGDGFRYIPTSYQMMLEDV